MEVPPRPGGGESEAETPPSEERPRVVLVNRCFVLDDQDRILLVRRSDNGQHSAGLWEPPGGKLDEGQDLAHATEREVFEESNLIIEPTTSMALTYSEVLPSGKYKGLPYIALFSIAKVVGGHLRLSDEHDDAAWATYEEALDFKMTPESYRALVKLKDYFHPSNT